MAMSRHALHRELVDCLVSVDAAHYGNCYVNPPSKGIKYPCIIYNQSSEITNHADNKKYIRYNRYTVTVIDPDIDGELKELVSGLPLCRYDRSYVADGLNHHVFTIFR